ncbi:MAG: hypothetical protein WCK00_14320 [Deltaproteobacteria bacterium]
MKESVIDVVPAKSKDSIPLLTDGALLFCVHRRDGTQTEHKVDLLVLKLACEDCEKQHSINRGIGEPMQPTPEFLIDLAERLSGFGLDNCTPTLAWQAWKAATEQMSRLGESQGEMPS